MSSHYEGSRAVRGHAVYLAWYRLRATLARDVGAYLSVVLLIGLVGGISMASLASARRTQSSYPTFLASTNPSDLTMAVYNAQANGGPGPSLTKEIARLSDVQRVRALVSPPTVPLDSRGAPRLSTLGYVVSLGSPDGLFLDQDRLAVFAGRNANPRRVNEVTMTASAARILGVRLGGTLPLGLYTSAQLGLSGFGTPKVKPVMRTLAKVVGIVNLNSEIVEDGVDEQYGFVFVTPAYLKEAFVRSPGHETPALYDIQLKAGQMSIPEAENKLVDLVPAHFTYEFHVTSRVTSEVELAIKPESVALGAFGVIAALACLVLSSQAIGRLLRRGDDERDVMRSLGASPADNVADGLLGVAGAIVLGSLVAQLVALSLSPLAPLGPVRAVYPSRGLFVDWTVQGLGLLVLLVGLGAMALAVSLRAQRQRVQRSHQVVTRPSSVVRAAQAAGLSIAGVVGVHFAVEPGRGRTAVPVRSVMFGTALAVTMVIATVTFASGLGTLVSHPALYGWNWNYALNPTNDVPPSALAALQHDPDVAAWSSVDYTDAEIDGETFPILLMYNNAKVAPPILTGHEVRADNQIVLGAATMQQLHKQLGDTVVVSYGSSGDAPAYVPPTTLTIVGTATLPAVGYSSFVAEHTSMGTGAIVPYGIQPRAMQATFHSPDPNLNGPELVFVRMRPGVAAGAAKANLQAIARRADKLFSADPHATGNTLDVLGVERPAQIVDYRSTGFTPVILAGGLALGAIVALGLTLGSSVRRRKRDLALLKSFGFTRRQLMSAIGWQASVDAVVGVVVGVPLGVVLGRELWTLFARSIDAVPDATVPGLVVALVAVGTLVFVNLVAVLPGLSAARTSTALVLRAE
jgi:hypothetical protein